MIRLDPLLGLNGPVRIRDTLVVPWSSPVPFCIATVSGGCTACPDEAAPTKNPEAEAKLGPGGVCSPFRTPCRVFAHLNVDDGDGGLGLVEVSSHPVHCFWDEVQHQIQIHFIFLERKKGDEAFTGRRKTLRRSLAETLEVVLLPEMIRMGGEGGVLGANLM